MLVLTRSIGESVRIEDPSGRVVVVTVVKRSGNEVSLSFDAPRDVAIVRSELKKNDLHASSRA